MNRASRWRSVAGVVGVLVGAAFLGRTLLRSTEDLADLSWRLSLSGTVGSLVLLVVCLSIAPLMWQRILVDFGYRRSFRDSFAIYFVMALTKYLPGSVWAYVGIAHYGRRIDLPAGTTIMCTLVQQAVACGGSVLAFGAALLLWPDGGWTYALAAAVIWIVAALVLLSPLPKRLLSLIADRVLHQNEPMRFTRTAIIVSLFQFLGSLVFFAVGYYWLLQGFYPTSFKQTLLFTGIYTISWLVGFLAVVTPSGLGIREGVQAYLLSFLVPPSVAVTIALVQRVWLTVGDLVTGLISLGLLRRSR